MRGDDLQQAGMFSYLSPEQRVPQNHPLRALRKLSDGVAPEEHPFHIVYSLTSLIRMRSSGAPCAVVLQRTTPLLAERMNQGI
jgi:hypothetical protein